MDREQNKNVLVTGGTGFIGSHLVEELVRRGAKVTAVDAYSLSGLANIRGIVDHIDLRKMDIRSSAFREFLLRRHFDVIFHLAANAYVPTSIEDPYYDFMTNLAATFEMLETVRRAKLNPALVITSSAAVYGDPKSTPISETTPTDPISPYGVSKLAIERYVYVYCQVYGLRAASIRLFSVYGPRQRKQIVYDLFEKISENANELEILGDGTQVRDLVYVEDVVRAALAVLENAPLNGEVYNVGSGKGHTTREIAEAIVRVMGVNPRFNFTGSVRPGDCQKWIASIDRIRTLGFSPQVTLEEGIARTLAWYKAQRESQMVSAYASVG